MVLTVAAPKVTTRRAALRRPRDHDTGHVIIGIGYAFACSCGATGSRRRSYREAMNEGREHAAAHTAETGAQVHTPTERETRGETMAPRETAPAGDGSPGRPADCRQATA